MSVIHTFLRYVVHFNAIVPFLTPFCAFLAPFCAFLTPFFAFLTPFCAFFGEIIEKVIESRYIGHFLIIGQIIDIDLILP